MSGVYSLADLLRQVIRVGEELLLLSIHVGTRIPGHTRAASRTLYRLLATNSWRAKQVVRDNPPTEELIGYEHLIEE